MWIAIREDLPRPLDPIKFYNFSQGVKSRYEAELPWMAEKDMSPTFHKIADHPKLVLEKLPATLRIWMFNEEPLECKLNLLLYKSNDLFIRWFHKYESSKLDIVVYVLSA